METDTGCSITGKVGAENRWPGEPLQGRAAKARDRRSSGFSQPRIQDKNEAIMYEPRQRVHSPRFAAGLASEFRMDSIPYGEDSSLLAAGSFNISANSARTAALFISTIGFLFGSIGKRHS